MSESTMSIRSLSAQPNANEQNVIEDALAGVSHEFHNFVDDVEHLIKETSSLTGEELDQARTKLNERIATARDLVEKNGNSLSKQARKSVAAGNKYVHQQPWQFVGAGTAIGLLIGLALV